MTPESFNVRLAKVDYVERGRQAHHHAAMAISSRTLTTWRGATARSGCGARTDIASSQLDPAAAARFAVFQYMISNLDWAMTASPAGDEDCCHNSRLIGARPRRRG